MPSISVIIPVFNVEKFLCKCIDSVCSQTYTDFEVLLVDDGSSDSSGNICDRYASKDNRIRVIHQSNQGVSAARNKGLRESSSEFVTFVDADDWLENNALEKYITTAKTTHSDWIRCCYIKEYPNRSEIIKIIEERTINDITCSEEFLEESHLYGFLWNSLFKKQLLQGLSFDKDIQWCEDHIFSYKYLLRCHSTTIIPDPLYHYRVSYVGNLSSKVNIIMRSEAKIRLAKIRIKLMQGNRQKEMQRWDWCEEYIEKVVIMSYIHLSYKERKKYHLHFQNRHYKFTKLILIIFFLPLPFGLVDLMVRIYLKFTRTNG